jgi:hypothetical protein
VDRREVSNVWAPGRIRLHARAPTLAQTKLESINELYYKAPVEFSCSEVTDRASDCHSPSARIGEGSRNTSRWCWCRRNSN